MPIKIKIRGERVHKCGSCEQALCIRHDNEDTVTYCTYMAENPLVINRAVKECSHYQEERDVSSWEMRQIAWILRTEKSGRKMGFTPYRDLEKEEREKVDDSV